MGTTPGWSFYQRQIAALEAHDLETVAAQYHEDATLVNYDQTVRGREAIREFFQGYLTYLGFLKLQSTECFRETEDAIFLEATVKTQLGIAQVYDVFLLREGKATHHFAGIISPR